MEEKGKEPEIFNEQVQAFIIVLFYRELKKCFGARGVQAFVQGTQSYGEQRGRRMAQRAIRAGEELTLETYLRRGEWVNTEKIRAEGIANKAELTDAAPEYSAAYPDYIKKVTVCPWHEQFKEMDALEAGAGKELGIDPGMCMVAGVSRYGKSAAVAGAYDERFRVTIPSCSGAGGIAVYRTNNHGKTYDLSSLGGPEAWENDSINEPFENLTGGEGYWFCRNFRQTKRAEDLPVDQHMLCALAAGKGRHLIVITGITSEGWNNTEGQCLAYIASQPVWDLLGAGDQNNMIIHLDGHAILPSDMETILDYCDVHLLGKRRDGSASALSGMKGRLFLEENRDRLDPAFDAYEKEIRTILSY